MNYYEELGVSPSASLAEIQQAYRSLVRIIHPDHQQDARLRKLSELQLLRLNQIAHTLADPVKRAEYDSRVAGGGGVSHPAAVEPARQEAVRTAAPVMGRTVRGQQLASILFLGLSAAVVGIGAFIWLSERNVAGPARAEGNRAAAAPAAVASKPAVGAKAPDVAAPVAERLTEAPKAEAVKAPEEKRWAAGPAIVAEKAAKPRETAAVKTSVEPEKTKPAEPAEPAKARRGLAGRWLYASRGDSDGQQMVEMQLALRDGQLRGKYYARYRGAEAEGSPEVRFQFAGREGATLMPWSSSTGARGEVRIKPLSRDRVEVTWFTTVHGADDRLVSGRAVLRRGS